MKSSQRLHILSKEEVAELYALPRFNATARSHYFLLPNAILNSLKIAKINGKNTSAKLYFILQYGYFKAKHQFFNINYANVKQDVLFIMQHYLPNDPIPQQLPTRKIQSLVKNQILQWMTFSDDINKVDSLILEKASTLAKITQNPLEIFDEIIKFLENAKMVLPKYSRLQDTIGAALKSEDKRLIQMMRCHLTEDVRGSLQNLFKLDDAFYHITELKFDAKSFQTKEMKGELKKLALCKPIYDFAKTFLPILSLSRL